MCCKAVKAVCVPEMVPELIHLSGNVWPVQILPPGFTKLRGLTEKKWSRVCTQGCKREVEQGVHSGVPEKSGARCLLMGAREKWSRVFTPGCQRKVGQGVYSGVSEKTGAGCVLRGV